MIDLTSALPAFVEYGGARYDIYTDFRVWIRLEQILLSREMAAEEKTIEMMRLCYCRKLPPDAETAVRLLVWFYCGGKNPRLRERERRGRGAIYDFQYDAELFYAAFLEQYGIDLIKDGLHWWKFLALFRGISENSRLYQAMRWRAMDLSGVSDQKQKRYYRKMKQIYRLPDLRNSEEADGDLAEALSKMMA